MENGSFPVANVFNGSNVITTYLTFQDDGDVLADVYDLDTSYHSVFSILEYNESNKILIGSIDAKYKMNDFDSRINQINTEFVNFNLDFNVRLQN